MTTTIQVHEATIRTAQVEIKSLTVNGRQVTLSLFRQLIEAPLFSLEEGFHLNGIPWGTVNYHFDNCWMRVPYLDLPATRRFRKAQHLHVVWQQQDELRRAQCVEPTWQFDEDKGIWVDREHTARGRLYPEESPDEDEDLVSVWQLWETIQRLPQLFIAV